MAGTKTNEREGTRAVLRHARVSPYKVREVLDLVRGRRSHEAEDPALLRARRRRASASCCARRSANAEHNDELDPDELFVAACFADEGPTLKRWRPRARGRATPDPQAHLPHHRSSSAVCPRSELPAAGPAPGRAAGPACSPGRRRPPDRGDQPRRPPERPPRRPGSTRLEPTVPRSTSSEAACDEATDGRGRGHRGRRVAETEVDEDARGDRGSRGRRTATTAVPTPRPPRQPRPPTRPKTNRRPKHDEAVPTPSDRRAPTRADERRDELDGSEGQPVRVPPRHHHRLEVALVRRPRLPGLPDRGLEDPRLPDEPARAGRGEPDRDRAHP